MNDKFKAMAHMDKVTIIHPFFGLLTFEPSVAWYVGMISYNDMPLKVNFACQADQISDVLLAKAQQFLDSDHFINTLILAMDALLHVKNEAWLDDDEVPFIVEELFDFISIDAIVFHENSINIYSYETDVFWGNRAVVRVSYTQDILDTHIEEVAMDDEE